jgi:organic hydroperoxide reductase OsmC/OhrA
VVKAPAAPPVVATKPAAPQLNVPDDPFVAAWGDCVRQALQNYEQSHNIHALQVAAGSCQVRLEAQGDENFARVEPPMPLTAPAEQGGRRNIGCGWWPIGSDADRNCATGGRRF